ncbi:16463_t:CDS:1, partial [Acaulospora morrowiae]
FNTTQVVNVISLFCGFLTIFAGVFLLNTARRNEGILDKSAQNGNAIILSSIPERHDSLMSSRDATLFSYEEESLGLTQLNNDPSDSDEE